MTVEEVKELVFNKETRRLCNCWMCGEPDGYCPTYSCLLLDLLKTLTDRQWKNVIKRCEQENDLDLNRIVEVAYRKSRHQKI